MRSVRDRDRELRGALFAGDGKRLFAALSQSTWEDRLQLAGDGLLFALAQGVIGASELTRLCVQGLRDSGWQGDGYLADQLDEALGNRPAAMLRPIRVDLEELTAILEGDPTDSGGRIDLQTGDVWPQAALDYF